MKDRLRRTRLYLPGNNPHFLEGINFFGADQIIIDLEDAIAPAEKDSTRILVKHALKNLKWENFELTVRINPLSSPYGEKDLEMIVPGLPDGIYIPKSESAEDIKAVENKIEAIKREHNIDKEILLFPIIETSRGVLNAFQIASASKLIGGIAFGAEDFTADIGAQRTKEGRESFVARSLIVLAARSAGVQALDTVWSDIEDMEGLIESTKESKALGFDGRGVIHPSQVEPVHKVFAPSPEEIERAQQIIAAMEEALRTGSGVIALGRKMIDAPVLARAKRTIEIAKLMGLI